MRLSLNVFPIVTTVLTHKMWLNVAIEPEFGRCGCSTEAEAFTATVQRLQRMLRMWRESAGAVFAFCRLRLVFVASWRAVKPVVSGS